MGARGPVKTTGKPVPVRLEPALRTRLAILAAAEGVGTAALIRLLVWEAIRARQKSYRPNGDTT